MRDFKLRLLFTKLFCALLLTVGATEFALSQNENSKQYDITLSQAIELAVANSPQINRAILAVDDADQLVRIARGEVFPEIISSINYTRNVEIPVTFIPAQFFDPTAPEGQLLPVQFGTDNSWQGGFSVSQNLFKGEAIVALSSSVVFKTVQKESLRATSQQVITQTRLAYYSVLVSQEQLRLIESQINRLEDNLKENQARADAGIVDQYDVLRLEVQLSNQRPQQTEAKYAVDEAYRNLKTVLGVPLDLELSVKGNLSQFNILDETSVIDENRHLVEVDRMNPIPFSNKNIDSLEVTELRGDLRVIDASLSLKDKEIRAIKSRFLPTLTANYNLQWTSAQQGDPVFFENEVRFQTLGLNLNLPLFQGFTRLANVERARIERKDIEQQKRQTMLTAENEIISASQELNKLLETANARSMALEQSQEGYERAKIRFENGLGSQFEITEAEVQVREAELNYAVMVFNYLSAKAQFDLATGMVPFVDTK